MSCNTCSNSAFTCAKFSFSMPTYPKCTLATYLPSIPAHCFNLICNNTFEPIICPALSPNHGVSCSSYNGYSLPSYIILPGHMTSCPTVNHACCGCCSGEWIFSIIIAINLLFTAIKANSCKQKIKLKAITLYFMCDSLYRLNQCHIKRLRTWCVWKINQHFDPQT